MVQIPDHKYTKNCVNRNLYHLAVERNAPDQHQADG